MAPLSTSKHLTVFLVVMFLAVDSNSSFSFSKLSKDSGFESNVTLYGDAKFVNGGYAVQLTRSISSSSGLLMLKKPIKLVQGNYPQKLVSFYTHFKFSLSSVNGDGLAFVIVPSAFSGHIFCNCSFGLFMDSKKDRFKVVIVKFNTLMDAKNESLVNVHMGIDFGHLGNTKVSNGSSSTTQLVVNSGNKLHAWIDYEAGSKTLEVRLSQFDDTKPSNPLLWYPIDMSRMWKDERAFIGLTASNVNSNSSQTCYLYSWNFEQRHVPYWMHSEPLDPKTVDKNSKPQRDKKREGCVTRVMAVTIFGAGCGALGAIIVLYSWTIYCSGRPVVPEECALQHSIDFECNKVKVVACKAIEDA